MTGPNRWEIPRKVWLTLTSLVAGVVVLFAVAGFNQWIDQHENSRRDADLRAVLCDLTKVLSGGPAPLPGPAGDRARAVIPRMDALQKTVCREG